MFFQISCTVTIYIFSMERTNHAKVVVVNVLLKNFIRQVRHSENPPGNYVEKMIFPGDGLL